MKEYQQDDNVLRALPI